MACTNDKFVINKGMGNEFIITIKQNDSTLPLIIELTDTFEVSVYNLETQVKTLTVNLVQSADGIVEIYDAPNGQILVKLEDVDSLISERGAKVDRYYPVPTYRLAIDCATVNNGNFVAKINEVYVIEG